MHVITLEDKAFYALVRSVVEELESSFAPTNPWVLEPEAMTLLGIKSKTTLQRLRDNDLIRFSQPTRKHILYYKPSLYEYLENNSNISSSQNSY